MRISTVNPFLVAISIRQVTCLKGLDFFAQLGSYHLIYSNKQLITGSLKFPYDSIAEGNKSLASSSAVINKLRHEKTCLRGFLPTETQTRLLSYRS